MVACWVKIAGTQKPPNLILEDNAALIHELCDGSHPRRRSAMDRSQLRGVPRMT